MTSSTPNTSKPDLAADAVLKPSAPIPDTATQVHGLDFNAHQTTPITIDDLLAGLSATGFQASSLTSAVSITNSMITWRSPENPAARTTIFLGYTSNLVSSGLREILRYLVQHKHVSAIVTTAGGVEEDLIKCLGPTYLGAFDTSGAGLREKGLNRIGNLLVPNDNYCKFEDWIVPIFDTMLLEQEEARATSTEHNAKNKLKHTDSDWEAPFTWTPSSMIRRLGLEMDDDSSIYTWAARNDIPVFCPALTDGSLGDMLYFHSYRAAPAQLTLDLVKDIRRINDIALKAERAGMIILGGGIVKHHIANACLMRNGADSAVYINTGQEFDGSDAGARPDEAVSWGKIKSDGESVKVYAEATVVWPLIVAGTFVRADREGRGGVGKKDEESIVLKEEGVNGN
jgi:deoxyhypusine synthase